MTESPRPTTLNDYVCWWPQAYEIIGLYNDEHRLIPSSIKEIEEFEEQSALSKRKNRPELIEEVGDIYIMLLQLVQLLDVKVDGFLASMSVSASTVEQACEEINKGKKRLKTYAASISSNPHLIISITHDILSSTLTFSQRSGFSATEVAWMKAQYNMASMPIRYWQKSYILTHTHEKNAEIQTLFALSRKLTKDHQKKYYPKEQHLYPELQYRINSSTR